MANLVLVLSSIAVPPDISACLAASGYNHRTTLPPASDKAIVEHHCRREGEDGYEALLVASDYNTGDEGFINPLRGHDILPSRVARDLRDPHYKPQSFLLLETLQELNLGIPAIMFLPNCTPTLFKEIEARGAFVWDVNDRENFHLKRFKDFVGFCQTAVNKPKTATAASS